MNKLLNGVSGLVIGSYLAAVIWQSAPNFDSSSNIGILLRDLEQDYGYLEFIAAAGALALLLDVEALRPLAGALIGVAVFAVLARGTGAGSSVLNYLDDVAKGRRGLFGETPGTDPTASSSSSAPSSPAPAKLPSLPALPAITST